GRDITVSDSLTNTGRIVFVNVIDGSIAALFVLPAGIFRYRKMYWCIARTSFVVFGETKKPLHGVSTHHIVALFRAAPIRYDGLFMLQKKDFGFANDIGGFSEFLIVFSRYPRRVIAYNIGDFPLLRSTRIHRYEDGVYEEILFDPSATIVDIPKRQFAFDGNWDFIQIGLTSSIYMLHPSSKRGSFLLGDWTNRPIRIPFSLKQTPNASIQTNDPNIFFHLDGSGRVLCVEDSFVVSYYLRAIGDMLEYVEQWRRKLWVDSSFYDRLLQGVTMTSRFGRQIRLPVAPLENYIKEDRLMLIDICFDVDNELIYIICICDMNSIVFDNPDCPCNVMSAHNRFMDRRGLVFILDDRSGEIIRIIMQCNDGSEEWHQMKFSTTGITAAFELRCREGTYIEVQGLLETGVKEWDKDGSTQESSYRRPMKRRTHGLVNENEQQ
uniref:Uncharacterized protein n=1 Tax=Parascaris univalens TaxID=6257 RepID=A0A915AA46_PARUN